MEIHRANPYLDHLLTPEGNRLIASKLYILKKPKETPPKNQVLWDPKLGDYQVFTWKVGFDPIKEIVVTTDSYRPDMHNTSHSHDFFEIVYVYAGRCRTMISGYAANLSAGDLCIYNLQAIHKMEFFQPGDVIFNIVVRQELFRRLILELLSKSDAVSSFFIHSLYNRKNGSTGILLPPDENFQCEQLAQQIIETYYREEAMCQNALKTQLMLLLLEIAKQHQDCQNQRAGSHDLTVEEVVSYINYHYQTATLEDTACHFGYSTRSMTRFLQKYTGYSFREVLRDIRFSHARSMLQETCLSIEEIALAVGYKDRCNFETAFKKCCHITPSAYRRQFFVG